MILILVDVCRFVPLVQWPFILRSLDNTHLQHIFEMLVQRILKCYVCKYTKSIVFLRYRLRRN